MTAAASPIENSVSDLAGIGQLLRQQRVDKGMTIEDIARALRLHTRQIIALENGDFSGFRSAAFAKGYLRSCAKLYGIDGDKLVNVYDSLLPKQKSYMPTAAVSSQKIILASRRNNKKIFFLLLLIVLIVGVAYLVWSGSYNFPNVLPEKIIAIPAESVPDIGAAPSEIPGALSVLENVSSQPADASVVQPSENQSIMTPSQDVQDSTLHIEFIDDCWVQLKTDDGKVLHEKTHKKGEVFDMSLKAPIHVWFGRAAAVNVSYNGAVVDVPVKPGFQSAQFVLGDRLPSSEIE